MYCENITFFCELFLSMCCMYFEWFYFEMWKHFFCFFGFFVCINTFFCFFLFFLLVFFSHKILIFFFICVVVKRKQQTFCFVSIFYIDRVCMLLCFVDCTKNFVFYFFVCFLFGFMVCMLLCFIFWLPKKKNIKIKFKKKKRSQILYRVQNFWIAFFHWFVYRINKDNTFFLRWMVFFVGHT